MSKFLSIVFGILGVVVLLSLGQSVIVPFLVAIFGWYLINALATYYAMVMPRPKSKWTKIFSLLFSIATTIGLVWLFVIEMTPNIHLFMERWPQIQSKLIIFLRQLLEPVGITISTSAMNMEFNEIAMAFRSSLAGLFTSMGLILVYIFFMFIEQGTFVNKIRALFSENNQHKKILRIFRDIDHNMKKYLFIRTVMSSMMGVSSYLWMSYFNLELAGFWAFLIFVLMYIPTFGSILACALPILYSLLFFRDISDTITMGLGIAALQIVIGNILEPKLTGQTLNLSTLAILVNLVFWGILWGPVGMFFSVPLLVAILVVTSQFDSMRPFAILLSANGIIPDKEEDDN